MTTQNGDFDPYDLDAIERAQRLEDGEDLEDEGNNGDGQGDGQGDEGGDAGGDDDLNPEGNAEGEGAGDGAAGGDGSPGEGDDLGTGGAQQADAEVTAKVVKPTGVASKDGTRVLPYSALTRARKDASVANEQLAQARAQIEELKKGAAKPAEPPPDDNDLSAEELEAIETDFPQLGKLVKAVKSANTKLAQIEKATTVAAKPAVQRRTDDDDTQHQSSGDTVQDAIDANPDLLTWQTDPEHASKFQRAQQVDGYLQTSPKWRDKPMADRFAEVARLVRAEFDLADDTPTTSQTTTTRSQPTPPAKKVAAKEVINRTQRRGPTTLSDLKGGAAPARDNLGALTATSMLNRFEAMSTEEMLAQLDRGG